MTRRVTDHVLALPHRRRFSTPGDDVMVTAVLVIEDDDRIRRSLVLALEDEGYTVTGVATAEGGLPAQHAEPADTALVDLLLPGVTVRGLGYKLQV